MPRLLSLLLLTFCSFALSAQPLKVACVGNSVTYGMTIENRERDSYPAQLQRLLGEGYEVRNFGHSGATLLNKGHMPYTKQPEYQQALDYKADLVVIHLGLNDTDPRNWPHHRDDFLTDYYALIQSFRDANPEAQIHICLMTPIFTGHRRYLSGTRDWHAQIQEKIRQVAENAHVGLIDLFTPLHCRPDLFPDNLHPNAKGAGVLAKTVYNAIKYYRPEGLQLPMLYKNGMVLQRETPLRIEGRAPANADVRVAFRGEFYQTRAEANGTFCLHLPAQTAGGPFRMEFEALAYPLPEQDASKQATSARRRRLEFPQWHYVVDSVYVGEVWLCSGQSNMEYTVREFAAANAKKVPCHEKVHVFLMKPSRTITSDEPWDSTLLQRTQDLDFLKVRPWHVPTESTLGEVSAIGFMAAAALADSLGVHVGLIQNAVGGAPCESYVDRSTLEWDQPGYFICGRSKENDYLQDWVRKCIALNTSQSANPLQRHPYDPSYLYENGIAPLEGYTLRGVWWYQGCSNAHNVELHERTFQSLLKSWRKVFYAAEGTLPFYMVQLSGIASRPSFPHFRDSQRRLAETLPGVHLIVSSDVGDPGNIHPARKAHVAARLAQSALHYSYGRENLPAEGPKAEAAKAKKNGTVEVLFSHAAGYLLAAAPSLPSNATKKAKKNQLVAGFQLCGADGLWHDAEAVIPSAAPCTVRLTCKEVQAPCGVRYAWKPNPADANLVNAALLPASTFEIKVTK